MSKEAAKLLPEYMLSSQLIDLRNAKYDEFRIDEQRNKIFDKQSRGLTIEEDLKGYVRGKDEYLGQIEQLLIDTKKSVSEMDTSNPYVAQRMDNYVNYLTILKGRQNQRYIDFLDMSIKDYRADIDQSINMYNRDLETVNKLITDESALTTEAHTNIKNMLTEMYDNIESREDRQWTLDSREIQRAEATRNVTLDELNRQLLKKEVDGYGIESDPVSPATFDKFKTFFGSEDADGNFVFDTHNLFEVLNTANVTEQNEASVKAAFYQLVGRNIYSNASTGNVSGSDLEKFKDSIRASGGVLMKIGEQTFSVNDMANSMTTEEYNAMTDEEKDEFEVKSYNSEMKNKIELNLRKGIEAYLTSSDDKIKELRAAIEDLSLINEGWFTSNWSRDKYVKKNEGLGEFSGYLYDYVEGHIGMSDEINKENEKLGGKKMPPATWSSSEEYLSALSDEDLIYELSDKITDYLIY